MNVFLALPVAQHVKSSLHHTAQAFGGSVARWQEQERLHLTLAFLGEIKSLEEKVPELAKPMPQTSVATIKISHVGIAPNKRQLWAFVEQTKQLSDLRQQVVSRLEGLALEHDNKEFLPHINLGDLKPEADRLQADKMLSVSYVVNEIFVYQSAPGAAKYRELGQINLSHAG